ncbi:VPLPA-CTERM sorting domain-containing protein [Roseobacter weihaiensis]|uniref:VPLPA-CTERM sorting domain-containing protein n=1 Tax=Roseobacter weihaiensis TaxID=2763262 RepID=UPI001D0B88C3|nr:VPLPA-CTERM sorting domain-containing protein [Roseobacter sp. H9]
MRDTLFGNPDAAAASAVIDATGFKNITVSFTWRAFFGNEASDDLYLSWAFDPAPALTDQNAWTEVFSNGSETTTTFSETVSLGSAADGALFNLMFWSDVSASSEGFKIDDVVVTGEAITPVPLPASLPLMAAALAGFGIMRRRKAAT